MKSNIKQRRVHGRSWGVHAFINITSTPPSAPLIQFGSVSIAKVITFRGHSVVNYNMLANISAALFYGIENARYGRRSGVLHLKRERKNVFCNSQHQHEYLSSCAGDRIGQLDFLVCCVPSSHANTIDFRCAPFHPAHYRASTFKYETKSLRTTQYSVCARHLDINNINSIPNYQQSPCRCVCSWTHCKAFTKTRSNGSGRFYSSFTWLQLCCVVATICNTFFSLSIAVLA